MHVFCHRSLPVGSLAPLSRLHHRGGVEECLVPVLDACNHRAGSVAALAVERGAAAPAAEACWVLRAGRAVAAGEEVLINYGAKGDGELLRAHGFVLGANPADVCPLDLTALLPAAPAAARAARLDACARRGLPTRVYLHHGGCVHGHGHRAWEWAWVCVSISTAAASRRRYYAYYSDSTTMAVSRRRCCLRRSCCARQTWPYRSCWRRQRRQRQRKRRRRGRLIGARATGPPMTRLRSP